MKKSILCLTLFLTLIGSIVPGCTPPEPAGPSYSELVKTYNAEVETLTALETKRGKTIADFVTEQQRKLCGALNSLTQGALPTGADKLLDQAAELAQKQQEELAKSAANAGAAMDSSNFPQALAEQLKPVDAEIAAQKERVERAKKARDAAEPK
ncbi:MAG: hypothetical protein U0892_04705 [Pirellulales bacterium]